MEILCNFYRVSPVFCIWFQKKDLYRYSADTPARSIQGPQISANFPNESLGKGNSYMILPEQASDQNTDCPCGYRNKS